MVRHLRGAFKRAAILQVICDARGAKGVVADARVDAGGFRVPLNHRICDWLAHLEKSACRHRRR
jgi:hypothetical protein